MPPIQRRPLLKALALGAAGIGLGGPRRVAAATANTAIDSGTQNATQPSQPLLLPARLRAGDTIGLISPSSATWESERFAVATETFQALGFKVREGASLRARRGSFAGTDAQRAQDINTLFADPQVKGIVCMTGGSGATRILNLLDYDSIRRNPKCLVGYSDVTALLNAIQSQTGLVCFHAPMGVSEWNAFSTQYFRQILVDGEAITQRNPQDKEGLLTQTRGRIQTLRSGKAQGRLLGGNLTVLTTLMGTPYRPDFRGAILFLEDVNEYIYRVDRMLSHLKQAGVFDALAGVVLGQFTDCKPGEGYGSLTLDEVFDDYFKPLNIPVYYGAMFGHVKLKFTLPVGLPVQMDADQGSITLLQAAVRSI